MTRACHRCEWGRDPSDYNRAPLDTSPFLACRVGPIIKSVPRNHWCGQFDVAERLTGGRDVRGKS